MTLLAQLTPPDTSWTSWLPTVLQQPQTYFTAFVSFAAFGLAKTFPKTDRCPWIPEAASIVVGIGTACGLKIGESYIYAGGCGIICAWAASSFYNLAFFWVTARLRSVFGQPTPPDPVKSFNTMPSEPKLNDIADK